ncbi:unnamed protein product [Closterium sp. NIES-65]|nr:unnamed protein product [Closterium sp. NIES-65]
MVSSFGRTSDRPYLSSALQELRLLQQQRVRLNHPRSPSATAAAHAPQPHRPLLPPFRPRPQIFPHNFPPCSSALEKVRLLQLQRVRCKGIAANGALCVYPLTAPNSSPSLQVRPRGSAPAAAAAARVECRVSALEEVRLLQQQRVRLKGIAADGALTGAEGAEGKGGGAGAQGEAGEEGEGGEELVLQDTFAQETAITVEDPNMYVKKDGEGGGRGRGERRGSGEDGEGGGDGEVGRMGNGGETGKWGGWGMGGRRGSGEDGEGGEELLYRTRLRRLKYIEEELSWPPCPSPTLSPFPLILPFSPSSPSSPAFPPSLPPPWLPGSSISKRNGRSIPPPRLKYIAEELAKRRGGGAGAAAKQRGSASYMPAGCPML